MRVQAHAYPFVASDSTHTKGGQSAIARGDPVSPLTGRPAAARPHLLIGGRPWRGSRLAVQ